MISTAPLSGTPYWNLESPFNRAIIAECREVPGLWFDPRFHAWTGYRDAIARVRLRLAKKGFVVEGDVPYAEDWRDIEYPLPVAEKGLEPYQAEAVQFCLARGREGAILALAPGAGKSACALTWARALREKTVIVVPSSIRAVWTMDDKEMGQIRRWWPAAFPHLIQLEGTSPGVHQWRFLKRKTIWLCGACGNISGPGPAPPQESFCAHNTPNRYCKVVVVHYDIVYAHLEQLIAWGFKTVIFDEGHLTSNPRSRRGKACAILSSYAENKLILTGTPLLNRPRDLWGMVEIISPGRFGAYFKKESEELQSSFFPFGKRYCDGHQITTPGREAKVVWDFAGKSHQKELSARMKHFMLYRTKEELGIQLPPMTTEVVEIEVKPRFRIPPSLDIMKSQKLVRRTLAAAADGKFDDVLKLAVDDYEAGHKKIIFTVRRALAQAIATSLAAKGIHANFIHGELTQKRRDAIVEAAHKMPPDAGYVVACTFDSTMVGIDLTFADIADVAEFPYEPWKLIQARARLHRRRQKKNVLIRLISAKGTTDDLVKEMLLKKIRTFEEVIGDTDEDIGAELDNEPKGQAALDDLYEMMKKRVKKEEKL